MDELICSGHDCFIFLRQEFGGAQDTSDLPEDEAIMDILSNQYYCDLDHKDRAFRFGRDDRDIRVKLTNHIKGLGFVFDSRADNDFTLAN